MPWMPEVFSAPIAEAIRHGEAESANDAVAYYEGIMANQPQALVRSFASDPYTDALEAQRLQTTDLLTRKLNKSALV